MARRKTEVYYENEREFDASEHIEKVALWKEKNSFSAIQNNQLGLIPSWMSNIVWRRDETYFKNERYEVNRDDFTTVILLNGIMNNLDIDESNNRFYDMNMIKLVNKGIITPFLLFIDGQFILWSNLDIVRSDDKYAFKIRNRDRDIRIGSFKLLRLPTNITYDERFSENGDKTLFSFDGNGRYTTESNAMVHVCTDDPNIQVFTADEVKYDMFDTGIDVYQKLFTDNIFLFSKEGLLVEKEEGEVEIMNRNLITINSGNEKEEQIVILWNDRSNKNESASMRGINHQFIKKVMNAKDVLTNYKTSNFFSAYECAHDEDTPYNDNISNNISYNFSVDHNKFDQSYQHYSSMKIYEYTLPNTGECRVLRDVYEDNDFQSFPIIFYNGLALPDINNQIEYHPDHIVFPNPKDTHTEKQFMVKDTVEIVWFKKVINGKFEPKIDNKTILVSDSYIPADDIIPLMELPEKYLAPVNFTLSEDKTKITLKQEENFNNKLYLVSRNQFIHKKYTPTNNMIELGEEFETAYDDDKFMIFADGRFLSKSEYTLLIPSISNHSFIKKKALYLKFNDPSKHIIDVYYCSGLNPNRVGFVGDLLIEEKPIYTDTDKQVRFLVPYPFKNYPREYTSFFIIKNDVYVDKARYKIDGDYIEFYDTSESLFAGQRLTFVFPYYRQEWDSDGEVDEDSVSELLYYRHRTTSETNVVVFQDNGDGIPKNECNVHIFKNTTFISPDRYTRDGLKVTFNDPIKEDIMVTMVAAVNTINIEENTIVLDVFETLIQRDGEKRFAIPSYTDSFFIIYNSLVLSPSRYKKDGNTIVMLDDEVYKQGEKLLFVYAHHKDNPRNILGSSDVHFVTETAFGNAAEEGIEAEINTDNFMYFGLTISNCLIFVNSTYYEPERYKIEDNKVILLDGTKFKKDTEVVAIFVREEDKTDINTDGDSEDVIIFEDIDANIRSNSNRYFIPYPMPVFKGDTPFFVTIGNSFVPQSRYTIDEEKDIIIIDDILDNFRTGHKIRFTFVHDRYFTHISKNEASVTLTAGQKVVDIPVPFNRIVNLNRRMLVVYGGVHLSKERYTISSKKKKLYLNDLTVKEGDQLHFIFFFTGTEHTNLPNYLPASGYFRIRKSMIDRNFNKEMMLVFVNGRLIPRKHMLDISNIIHKITVDIGCRYNLSVLSSSPLISRFKNDFKTLDEWSDSIKNVPV